VATSVKKNYIKICNKKLCVCVGRDWMPFCCDCKGRTECKYFCNRQPLQYYPTQKRY